MVPEKYRNERHGQEKMLFAANDTQRCRKERRVVVLVQVGVILQAATAAANSTCAVRAEAVGRMARSGAVGASRWVLNE